MGQSTNGQICFGNAYEEDFEFPWDAEPWNGDHEDWWRAECGYAPSKELFDGEGDYIDGIKPEQAVIDAYFKEQRDFDAAHPFPVSLVNYCSGDYPMWILAVPSSVLSNSRGEARAFRPAELDVSDEEIAALREFCIKYDLIPAEDATWYLTSYWG